MSVCSFTSETKKCHPGIQARETVHEFKVYRRQNTTLFPLWSWQSWGKQQKKKKHNIYKTHIIFRLNSRHSEDNNEHILNKDYRLFFGGLGKLSVFTGKSFSKQRWTSPHTSSREATPQDSPFSQFFLTFLWMFTSWRLSLSSFSTV